MFDSIRYDNTTICNYDIKMKKRCFKSFYKKDVLNEPCFTLNLAPRKPLFSYIFLVKIHENIYFYPQ
jgi:hypothetical protein